MRDFLPDVRYVPLGVRSTPRERPSRSLRVLAHSLAAAVLVLISAIARADSPPRTEEPTAWWALGSNYVLGLGLVYGPEYEGADRGGFKVRPIWAFTVGKVHLSGSGASAIQGFASLPVGPGLSAEFFSTDRLRVGLGLRYDSGRSSGNFAHLAGVHDVKGTLRGRLSASYKLHHDWSASAEISQDLLGRQGGSELRVNLNYLHMITEKTSVLAELGVSMADGEYMHARFGISEADAARTTFPVYTPDAGVKDVHLSVGAMTALTPRWIAYARAGVSSLMDDARASPIVRRASSASVSVGLAYRCCK